MTGRLYDELAPWWPLLSAPAEYAEEAEVIRGLLLDACRPQPRTLLELGSGGGNTASHLKAHFRMTLVDRAAGMLAVNVSGSGACVFFDDCSATVDATVTNLENMPPPLGRQATLPRQLMRTLLDR